MNYKYIDLKEGIRLHTIKTKKFKTNIIAMFITVPLTRENVTKDTLIDLILHRGSNILKTQEDINKKLEDLYGAVFDYGMEKSGDNHILKFYIESINDKFIDSNEEILKNSIEMLTDIVFNPLSNGKEFYQEYYESEKEKLRQIIESKIDNKADYAFYRCVEEMYKDKPYGLYKYGYTKDLENIQNEELFIRYKEIINNSKIDIFISGDIEDEQISLAISNENIENLKARTPQYNIQNGTNDLQDAEKPKEVIEKMDVAQGKIVMGLNIKENNENTSYIALIYNAILGGTANSKLFQNVREKASLAYTAGSKYIKTKNNIYIKCGIDVQNYDKTISLVKEQLNDMEKGNFTDDDVQNAKRTIISTIKGISDEQDTEITFYLGQEISNKRITLEEYEEKICKISKQDIVNLAQKISINTIYFLRD